jgi:ParB/RepB/Spo0J family partition protein
MSETLEEVLAQTRPGSADEPAAGEAIASETDNGGETSPGEVSPRAAVSKPQQELLEVPLDQIDKGPNIRKSNCFDPEDEDDQSLVESVRDGNQQPGEAVRKPDGRFELLYGFRRLEALKAAGRATMLLMVTDREWTAKEVIEKQLIENTQRKDMNPMDRAEAFAALKKDYKTARALAAKVTVPENVVSEYLTVHSYLPSESKKKLREGKLTFKAAYEEAKAKKEGKGSHKTNAAATPESLAEGGEEAQTSPGEVSGGDQPTAQPFKHAYESLGFTDHETGLVFVVGGKRKAAPSHDTLITSLQNWLTALTEGDHSNTSGEDSLSRHQSEGGEPCV